MITSKKIAHVVFWIICGSLSVYSVVLAFMQYFENADAPKISFRQFGESPKEDVYPDVTLCFNGIPNNKHIYDSSYLRNQHSLDKTEYQQLLTGDSSAWQEMPNASKLVGEIDFDNATTGLKKLIPYYHVILLGRTSWLTRDELIHKTYQIPGMICFTREFKTHLNGAFVSLESFKVSLEKFAVKVFLHYPGNVMRTVFGMDRIWKFTFLMDKKTSKEISNNIELKLEQMNVLKKRHDAVKPCDPTPTDDLRFWKEMSRRLICLPPYWKRFISTNLTNGLLTCKNSTDFIKMQDMIETNPMSPQIKVKEEILSSFTAPCNEIGSIIVNSKEKTRKTHLSKNEALVKINYNIKKYQEIRNEEDFGLGSLWSYIGGYVGIFVGYSLLNLLDDCFDLFSYCFNANAKINTKTSYKS